MRFFLDQNVDARVRHFFVTQGHDCWTADDSGLATEADPNLTIYAADHKAVLVTHDKAFSHRSRAHVVGRHIYLRCNEFDAVRVLEMRLADVQPILERHPDIFVTVSLEGYSVTFPSETW